MNDKLLKQYAQVILEIGINLYKGQGLSISTNTINHYFALILAEEAYKKGAKYVEISVISSELTKMRLNNSNKENLKFVPSYIINKSYEMLANDWASISLDNNEELDVLKDVDSEKLETYTKARSKAMKRRSEVLMAQKIPWCVAAVPGPKWASKVLDMKPTKEAEEQLWERIKPILRLNNDDPIKAWKRHCNKLLERCKILDNLMLDKIHFVGEGTDLEVGLSKYSRWIGGPVMTPEKRVFLPNVPTEEVFTTPDYHRTNGKVKITRPLNVMEKLVEGASFEFKDGKVVKFDADKGADVIGKYLKIDGGSSFLGEVALVDGSSAIYESGLLFHSILYDENATSHIALGAGYVSCFTNADSLKTDKERKEAGCNTSLVHTDFMIGSPKVEVYGVDRNGKEIPLIKNGSFQI
jgi:aminopeptidase